MTDQPAIVWFRDDLRVSDQPALKAAAESGLPLLCIYILDETSAGIRPLGGASRWWLHHSLARLGESLARMGGRLDILRGSALDVVPALAKASGAKAIFWTRRYGAAETAVDTALKSRLRSEGLKAASSNGQLLVEPWTVKTKTGGPYRVFTPFWRAVLAGSRPEAPTPAPKRLHAADWPKAVERLSVDQIGLLPSAPDWAGGLRSAWTPGEAGAQGRLADLLAAGLARYADDRDRPDIDATSRLSPHLRFGEISPRQIFAAVRHAQDSGEANPRGADKFLAELGWREFSYHLLHQQPDLATRNFQQRFDAFPWGEPDPDHLRRWRRGLTGYPVVDAGMRELWQTGTMHNRVRMITASFLIKHLMIDWRIGEQWFWDTLCDADPASNPASWQWVAGSGADAAPYFRIFNPILQGEKFDPEGAYVRKYIPELQEMPDKWIHKPWTAPPDVLKSARVKLGDTYPAPAVDHDLARRRALAAFEAISTAA